MPRTPAAVSLPIPEPLRQCCSLVYPCAQRCLYGGQMEGIARVLCEFEAIFGQLLLQMIQLNSINAVLH